MYYSHFTYRVCYNLNVKFKVCKSVHLRTIQINHQPDTTIFQFIILTFVYSSTCFGRFPVYHQELNECSSRPLALPLYLGDSRAVFVFGPVNRPDHENSMTITTIRR
jgi:hypothetical protein